ncbi:DDE-type integrase/transposase/recombinase [Streptomyces sp. NPDC093261]|uniref:DDE-type integrase/transposase/recombinase n=1 Tax=Streptomyces sp. NPDC093261 TaxID=3366037 RepID=UPI0037FC555A
MVQSRPDAKAAKRFMAQLMKKQRRVPRVLITDKMRSCPVAHGELMRSAEHRAHKGLNNRPRTATRRRGSVNAPRRTFARPDQPRSSCPSSARSHRTSDLAMLTAASDARWA